jgi:hypothetical protein
VEWATALPIDRIELIRDGSVAAATDCPPATSGTWSVDLDVAEAGWVAARCAGMARTSYDHPLWAHTSAVFLRQRASVARLRSSASNFVSEIDRSLAWLRTKARFDDTSQRTRIQSLYVDAREEYASLLGRPSEHGG